jgi:aminoglycoside/choline kinase family phosphotransferase
MGRNLLPREPSPGLTVIDHQDLRLGPRFYDLASLCNDSLFPPRWVEERLIDPLLESADCKASYHRAAAQRTLKAIGTFEAFARRGFDRHRQLIAPSLRRALHHLARLPETAALVSELQVLWTPLLDSDSEAIC